METEGLWYCNRCKNRSTNWKTDDWFLIERGHDKPYLFCTSWCAYNFITEVHRGHLQGSAS